MLGESQKVISLNQQNRSHVFTRTATKRKPQISPSQRNGCSNLSLQVLDTAAVKKQTQGWRQENESLVRTSHRILQKKKLGMSDKPLTSLLDVHKCISDLMEHFYEVLFAAESHGAGYCFCAM